VDPTDGRGRGNGSPGERGGKKHKPSVHAILPLEPHKEGSYSCQDVEHYVQIHSADPVHTGHDDHSADVFHGCIDEDGLEVESTHVTVAAAVLIQTRHEKHNAVVSEI
jgi:hypothetical protein